MTLVGRGYNSKISNRPLVEKLRFYEASSYLMTRRVAKEIRAAGVLTGDASASPNLPKLEEWMRERAKWLAAQAVEVLKLEP
jgi:hypothetical protein